ncbi:MAG: zinc-ribbon and DUF3426 domain-containing protein [Candidatus Accumulibacter sp.]|jgi:predicted Zn finger-like uncharacterized protein|nr:zinc-ribbon and DUF3426 domain-containing protein [Accumulibacter sp.]
MKARCPNCWTIFRATQEQLSARAGKVRCGQCHEVFNALGNLLDEDNGDSSVSRNPETRTSESLKEPVPLPQPEFQPELQLTETPEESALAAGFDLPVENEASEESEDTEGEMPLFPEKTPDSFQDGVSAPIAETGEGKGEKRNGRTDEIRDVLLEGISSPRDTPQTAGLPELSPPESPDDAPSVVERAGGGENGRDKPAADNPPDGVLQPRELAGILADATLAESFLARSFGYSSGANRPFKWAGISLGALLLFQVIGHFRGEIALSVPLFRPPLEFLSGAFGARIPLPRHARMIDLEVSDIQKDPEHGLLILEALLRNRANYGQAYPSLELSLTNANDEVVVRCVFEPSEYLPLKLSLMQPFAANADINIRLWIEVQDALPVGYRLDVIYP